METTINNISEVSREIEISAKASEIQPFFDKAYGEYRPKVEIKGFRKGKAPLELVKKLYGDMIEQETLPTVASQLYREAVKDQNLRPIGEPVIIDMHYSRGQDFRVKIQYDVRPEIKLKEYKGIKVEKPVHEVTEEEIDEEILRLRRMSAATEEADVVEGDEYIVTARVQELDPTGVPIIGKKTQNARFYLADPQLERPIHDALKSVRKGDEVRVNFRHTHGDHEHDVHLNISVTNIEKVKLPDFDAEFLKSITKDKVTDPVEFRAKLRADLEAYWKEKSRREVVNAIVAEIIRRHDFQVPESLTRSVLEGLLEDVKNQYPNKQLPSDFDAGQFAQENRAYAIYQSKWALLREEIVKAEGIEADDDDLTKLAEKEAERIGIDKERLVEYYRSSDSVKDRIISDKLMEMLVREASITEVPHKERP
ncbi:MAG: trigger factor [Bacteroidia bacterium]|nr:MAG: trigger factor [Bacteroidia bacterium]